MEAGIRHFLQFPFHKLFLQIKNQIKKPNLPKIHPSAARPSFLCKSRLSPSPILLGSLDLWRNGFFNLYDRYSMLECGVEGGELSNPQNLGGKLRYDLCNM